MKTLIILLILCIASPALAMESMCVEQTEEVSTVINSPLKAIPGLTIPTPTFTPVLLTVSGDLYIFSLKRGTRSLGVNVVVVADDKDIAHSFTDILNVRYDDIPIFPLAIMRGITTPKAETYSVLWDANTIADAAIIHVRNAQFCLYG